MNHYRRSFAKTAIFAAVMGTGCLFIGLGLLCETGGELPLIQSIFILPYPLRFFAGIVFVCLAMWGYSIAAGGVLALHYDAKGRAVF